MKASAGTFMSAESEEREGLTYADRSLRGYIEAGVLPGLQVIVDSAVVDAWNEDSAGVKYRQRGYGDLGVGLRYRLATEPLAISAGVDVRTPLYSDTDEVAGYDDLSAMEKVSVPDLGDGTTDVTGRLEAGLSLWPSPAWVSGFVAYRHRSQAFLDVAVLGVDAGWYVVPELLGLSAGAEVLRALGDDEITQSWLSTRGGSFLDIGAGVSVEALASWMPLTTNSEAGFGVMLGVSWKR